MSFEDLQNKKADELTDKIIQIIGEMWLEKQVGIVDPFKVYSDKPRERLN